MIITNLRCEYIMNPIGLDVSKPRLSWVLKSEDRCQSQTAYQVLVASTEGLLDMDEGDLWDSGKVFESSSNQIEYGGLELGAWMKCWWKVRIWDGQRIDIGWSQKAYWEMGPMCNEDWTAKWIGVEPELLHIDINAPQLVGLPSPYLRHEFRVDKAIVSARIYATALGVYELYLNGERVGSEELTPGWTDYNKRIQYQTYDVTSQLVNGGNVIGGILGDGWYTGNIAIAGRKQYGDYPLMLLAQMRIQYTDGEIEYITSNGSWKWASGPIRYSDMQTGEYYDSCMELGDWCNSSFNAEKWLYVNEYNRAYDALCAQIGPCVRVMKELKPVNISIYGNAFIFDMGQNMVGRVVLKVKGEAGTKITLRFGEMLNKDGSLYIENLRTAAQTDIYILKGLGEEYFEPHFTFHGFRYVELVGFPGIPDFETITGRVMYSALDETMEFECSNEMINKLNSNIQWGQRGNFLSIPTDCPQRDERMGWTGDGQIFARTACFNMNSAGFFTKWMKDVTDAQKADGSFTDVAPYVRTADGEGLVGSGNAAWGDAGIIVPWTLYLCYSDTRILEENYAAMCRYIEYMKQNSTNLIRPDVGYGDWLSIEADTPKDLMSTAYFAYSTMLMSKIANILGKTQDVQQFMKLFNEIKSAFNREFVLEDAIIKGGTQTCYLLALRMELLDEDKKYLAAQNLIKSIEEKDWHLSTGFVGVSYLLPVLSDFGFNDVAYRLLLNETYPSWLYSIKNGATTIWERWNSYTIEDGFGDIGMNSFNHYSLGSVGEWLYRYAAGINVDAESPGYRHIIIRPHPGGNMRFIKVKYNTIVGDIVCKWEIEKEAFILNVEIPANTTATLYLPHDRKSQITEGGTDISKKSEIRFSGNENGRAVVDIGSGRYEFRCNFV